VAEPKINEGRHGGARTESGMNTLTKRMGGKREAIDIENRTATFVFSTSDADRMGDIVDQTSWQLQRYMENPQFLFGHRSRELPIGRTIDLKIMQGKLVGTVKFATADEYAFADTCWKLVTGGYLNAVSVGFVPHRWEAYEADDRRGYKFFDCELLECSLVPIPANQNALLGTKDAGELVPVYRSLIDGYQDDVSAVFGRDDLETVLRSLDGTNGDLDSKFADDSDGQLVYDSSGEVMGLMVGGALKVARAYQDKLRNRNAALITQQASATTTEATTEKEKAPIVGPNFFLKRAAVRRLARNTLLGA